MHDFNAEPPETNKRRRACLNQGMGKPRARSQLILDPQSGLHLLLHLPQQGLLPRLQHLSIPRHSLQ
jgi:hypothetical protein